MAVSIKSLNGLGAIGKLGIDPGLVDWLSEGHYEIKLTSKEFAFFPAGSGDLPPVATVPVSLDLLQKLNGGTVPPKDKFGLAKMMTSTLEKLQSIADGGTLQKLQAGVPVDPALKAAMEKAKAEGIKAKIGEAQPAFTQPAPTGWWPVHVRPFLREAVPGVADARHRRSLRRRSSPASTARRRSSLACSS